MVASKINEQRAQELLRIVRWVLDEHDWCMQHHRPKQTLELCVNYASDDCHLCGSDIDTSKLTECDGCKMAAKAESVAKWVRGGD